MAADLRLLGLLALAPLVVLGLAALALIIFIAALAAAARPSDGAAGRDFANVKNAPLAAFRAGARFFAALDALAALKPAPARVPEMAAGYVVSQVLFALDELGVPDHLRRAGPSTPRAVAAAIGARAPPSWVARLLAAAAEFGLLARKPLPPPRRQNGLKQQQQQLQTSGGGGKDSAAAAAHETEMTAAVAGASGDGVLTQGGAHPARENDGGDNAGGGGGSFHDDELDGQTFALNAASAVLCDGAPCSMRNFVRLLRHNAEGVARLAEAIKTGEIACTLPPPAAGAGFWARLSADPERASVFDAAMREKDAIGGAALARAYPWRRLAHVVDVAGGNGQLLATLLRAHPRLTGALFDRKEQIACGRAWWAAAHADLLPRAAFFEGDVFDASTVPEAAAAAAAAKGANGGGGGGRSSGGAVAYVLSDVLHDWPDADCVRILRSLRARAGPAARNVKLLLAETTTSRAVLPALLRARRISDITMLCNFGGGRERDERAFAALLAAAGWRLERVWPAAGLLCVVEAAAAAEVA